MDARLERLIALLDAPDRDAVGTSVRLPAALKEAIALAVELGLAETTTELTVRGIRDALETSVQRSVLEAHYRQHPEARPDLGELAMASAELEGSPLAANPELVRRAAREVVALKPDATAEDVLLYAAGLAAAA